MAGQAAREGFRDNPLSGPPQGCYREILTSQSYGAGMFLSRVYPLIYLVVYLFLIPFFGVIYATTQKTGFYAPYARYEPAAVADTNLLATALKTSIIRSLTAPSSGPIIVDNWQLDLKSLVVNNVTSADGTALNFSVRFTANGIGENLGVRQMGTSVNATLAEHPLSETLGTRGVTVYRFPTADFSGYASPFKEFDEAAFKAIFKVEGDGFNIGAPALALTASENDQFVRFLRGIRGDPAAISGFTGRMMYLSVVIVTTLGLGDIVPITAEARFGVGAEATLGIMVAGLFLNALSYRVSVAKKASEEPAKSSCPIEKPVKPNDA
jgi:hypothetical protein